MTMSHHGAMSRRLGDILAAALTVAAIALTIGVSDTAADRLIGILVSVSAGMTLLTLNHTTARRPLLMVEYRNPALDYKVAAAPTMALSGQSLLVVLTNNGRGAAEAVEVRFKTPTGAGLYNESGNNPDGHHLDVTVDPPRFLGRDRILESRDEWVIASLHPTQSEWNAPGGEFNWEARARRMKTKRGICTVRAHDAASSR